MAVAALAVAGWHVGPAATWLPAVRGALSPALDGRGDPRRVALTFDDGPDPDSTPYFLAALDRLSVRATFFVLGSRLERHPDLGRRMVAQGHELAVHGWHHERPWRPRPVRDAREVARAADAVRGVCGVQPLWYRPPYGILTGGRWAAARRAGLSPVLWSAWGRDWTARATPDSVLEEVTRTLRGGATVLLHDTDAQSAPGSWRAALGALPDLVAVCRTGGLTVGRLADHGLARF
ncbi:polysaccharide deacetylase family protein [Streptomyces sp. A3M-1-3]|uniref:polysaccharide deacetylase family protein n=1 Tax=Streptomyces sp. A3M-1-3 TaxID=2962044 RepID=UPI0020B894B8|nr:polysaccharide deacetylase family protein [Streptomyces sp. A3M-1-3]MCP3822230.1 polysaccharide deacetylase family protein [Streptomyces sp. A3M-1-3]